MRRVPLHHISVVSRNRPERLSFKGIHSINKWNSIHKIHTMPNENKYQSGYFVRIKQLWKTYGIVAIGTYITAYVSVLGVCYASIEYPRIKARDNPSLKSSSFESVASITTRLQEWSVHYGMDTLIDLEKIDPRSGSFVVAWILTKFTEPLRLAFTVFATPKIAQLIKKVPKR